MQYNEITFNQDNLIDCLLNRNFLGVRARSGPGGPVMVPRTGRQAVVMAAGIRRVSLRFIAAKRLIDLSITYPAREFAILVGIITERQRRPGEVRQPAADQLRQEGCLALCHTNLPRIMGRGLTLATWAWHRCHARQVHVEFYRQRVMVVHLASEVIPLKAVHLLPCVVQPEERVGLVLLTQRAVQEVDRVVAEARAFLSPVGGVEDYGVGREASCIVRGECEAPVLLRGHRTPSSVSNFVPFTVERMASGVPLSYLSNCELYDQLMFRSYTSKVFS